VTGGGGCDDGDDDVAAAAVKEIYGIVDRPPPGS
jgi:hypothetical protein